MRNFYVKNFGCRAAQADGAAIEQQFRELGLECATEARKADVVVLNTCTVTAAADQDARSAIRKIRRENPESHIVVTGCYAQRAPEEIAGLAGVSEVVGNSHKHRLAKIVLSNDRSSRHASHNLIPISDLQASPTRLFVSDIFAHTELLAAPVFDAANERTRPNLKVQDGCDNRCSFCVIPYVRGKSRSLPLQQLLGEINSLVTSGYREVVISGINLGRWGRDFTKPVSRSLRFEDLVRAILDMTSLEKLRISSVEPMDWSEELISLMAQSPRIAKHAHVPMQSGSDRVLRLMHRKYRPWHYREKIQNIRAAMPDAAIGADVMVGFPGETDADFDETRNLVQETPLTYLHVFTYSPRPGTPAAAMKDQVPVHIARERNRILRQLSEKKKLAFMQSLVGTQIEAITLKNHGQHPSKPVTEALTDNFVTVHLPGTYPANRWIKSIVTHCDATGLWGVQASPGLAVASVTCQVS